MSKDNSKINLKNKKTSLKLKIVISIIILFFLLSLLGFDFYFFINPNSEDNQTQQNNQNYKENENYEEYKNNQDLKENVVIRVIDGDTFELANHNIIRLICVDTPEKGKKGYEEAKEFLEELVLFKEVYLEKSFDDKDKYGRLLRVVYLNETIKNLNNTINETINNLNKTNSIDNINRTNEQELQEIININKKIININKEIIENNYGKIFPYGNNTILNCEELLKRDIYK